MSWYILNHAPTKSVALTAHYINHIQPTTLTKGERSKRQHWNLFTVAKLSYQLLIKPDICSYLVLRNCFTAACATR